MSDRMVPCPQAYLLMLHQTVATYCNQVITSYILTIMQAKLCDIESAHMPVNETRDQRACVSYITPAIMYVTKAPGLQECWVLLQRISRHACLSCYRQVCMSVLLAPDKQPRYHCHRVNRHMSRDMSFPKMWYVRPAKPQISLRIRAV